MRLRASAAAVAVILLAACSPKAADAGGHASVAAPVAPAATPPATTPASAEPAEMPDGVKTFVGSWKVTSSQTAPWYDGNGAKPDVDPEIKDKTFVFTETSVSGVKPLACSKAKLTVTEVAPDWLYQGGLKDAAKDAVAIGFKSDKITSMNEGCLNVRGDLEMDYPMVDTDTIVFGINNVLYTLKRVKP